MNHWREPEALSPPLSPQQESQLPSPLYVQPTEEMRQAQIRREIHAQAMRDNPQGPFRLLGTGLFSGLTRGHAVTGVLGVLAGAAAGYFVAGVLAERAKKKGRKAKSNFRGKASDWKRGGAGSGEDDDLDPANWDDGDGDGDEDEDEG